MAAKSKYDRPMRMQTLRMPEPLHAALERKAKRDRKPKSQIIVATLAKALQVDLDEQPESIFE